MDDIAITGDMPADEVVGTEAVETVEETTPETAE